MDAGTLRAAAASPAAFRERLIIDAGGVPRRLAEVVEPWQQADFEAMDAGWMAVAGLPCVAPRNRAYFERPRGHSKTSDAVIGLVWCMLFARRRLYCVAAAGDQDQARLLRNAIARLVELNAMGDVIEVQQHRIIGKLQGSELVILSSDAPSSYGLLCDAILVDELSHWPKRDLWDSLLSAAAKRPRCLLAVATNAGFQPSWQWDFRQAIRNDPRWHVGILPGPCASWIDPDTLDEQRRLLPDVVFRRLWANEWTSGGGNALSEELITAAIDHKHRPMTGKEPGFAFAAGLDLGVRRDKSALCVVGRSIGGLERVEAGHSVGEWGERTPIYTSIQMPGDGSVRLAYTRTWTPPAGGQVDLADVEAAVSDVAQQFRCPVFYDPWQAVSVAQRLSSRVDMVEVPFTGTRLQGMATGVLEAFNSRSIRLYPDEELIADLRRLRVEERSFGFRLTSPRDGTGHGDLATAFSLALLGARDLEASADLSEWLDVGAF